MIANQNLILIEGAATYERVVVEMKEFELDERIAHTKDFLKIYPDFAPAHNDLAVLFYRAGNNVKALAHYEKAHKLDPRNVIYRKNLADFYFVELEWAGEAIQTYLEIIKENPEDLEALNALGVISNNIGRKEQARQFFTRTLQLDSGNQEAQKALSQLGQSAADSVTQQQPVPRLVQGEASPAQQAAEVAASQIAKTDDEWYRDAMACVARDAQEEAVHCLERLIRQNPRHALAHNDLGVLYQRLGNASQSRYHHEEAVRLEPENIIFQKNLADLLYLEFYAFEDALKIYVHLQAKAPQDVEVLKAIASICQAIGNLTDARFFLERVLDVKPWDREAQEALRVVQQAAGVQGER